ncbi:MAG: M28 family peptidase [Anaerolineae bacterium]|jgi:hypothetical protein|nr:M28 family peptidase [Anaerolineae bacterium]
MALEHIHNLTQVIGARPAGTRPELLARRYVRHALSDLGITERIDEQHFDTPNTQGYALAAPLLLGLLGRFMGFRLGQSAALLAGSYGLYRALGFRRDWIGFPNEGESGNLIVKFPAAQSPKERVILTAHLDSSKHRFMSAAPESHDLMRVALTASVGLMAVAGIAQLFGMKWLSRLASIGSLAAVPFVALDEVGAFVDGANDNASGIACLLTIAAQLKAQPLANTEVWLAFTGAGEVGGRGIQALLDEYRVELAQAWIMDVDSVGAGEISYVTHHIGLSHLTDYEPHPDSLRLAIETARAHPSLGVQGLPAKGVSQVAHAHHRGFRTLQISGLGENGFPMNAHQYNDFASQIREETLTQATQFITALLHTLDQRGAIR